MGQVGRGGTQHLTSVRDDQLAQLPRPTEGDGPQAVLHTLCLHSNVTCEPPVQSAEQIWQ